MSNIKFKYIGTTHEDSLVDSIITPDEVLHFEIVGSSHGLENYLDIAIFHKWVKFDINDYRTKEYSSSYMWISNVDAIEYILDRVNKFFSLYSSGEYFLSYKDIDYNDDLNNLEDGVKVIQQLAIETLEE